MAASGDLRGIPLDEYTRQCPPGWRPYVRNYTLNTYEEKLRLWMRMTDIPADCQGSVIVGRLKGSAYRIAMKIRLRRQDGTMLYQDEAVNAPAEAEDVNNALPATPSGLQQILADLRQAFGDDSQDLQAFHLDRLFDLHRGSHSLLDYLTAFKLRYEAAEEHAALNINHVGLTHLLLGKAGLAPRFMDDLMLKVDGDRGQFTEIYKLLMKFSKGQKEIGEGDQQGILRTYDDDDDAQPS